MRIEREDEEPYSPFYLQNLIRTQMKTFLLLFYIRKSKEGIAASGSLFISRRTKTHVFCRFGILAAHGNYQ
jgi:hypothetical protein